MRFALAAAAAFTLTAVPLVTHADPDGECANHWAGSDQHRPRLAVGLATSHLHLDGDRDGHQHGLVVRTALRHGVELEVELARAEIDGDDARTIGGAVIKAFGEHRLAPYVVAGGGGGRLDRADGSEPRLHYGEAGAGVMLRKRHLALGVDVRAGVREVDDTDAAARMTTTPSSDDDRDRYVRCRLVAMLYF